MSAAGLKVGGGFFDRNIIRVSAGYLMSRRIDQRIIAEGLRVSSPSANMFISYSAPSILARCTANEPILCPDANPTSQSKR